MSAARFLRGHFFGFLGISALVVVPCFWHSRIVAGDLASHVYNAWLAQLIERGQVPGLWIAPQWDNVLFDFLLGGLGGVFDLHVAEKIAVSFSVLIFFWGLVSLIAAATERFPSFLLPCVALFTYGLVFHMGFFNYYLALGFSFFGLAIFWKGSVWERCAAMAFAPLIGLAHPLGLVWFAGAAAFIAATQTASRRVRFFVPLAAATVLVGTRLYLWRHYAVEARKHPFFLYNGADQLVLFGWQYEIPAALFVVFIVAALAIDVIDRRRESDLWKHYRLPLQLYALVSLAVLLFPDLIRLPQYCAEVSLLTQRATALSAVLLCCLLGAMRPRKWHLYGSSGIAIVFFALLWDSTGALNRMESRVEQLVASLPPGERVLMAWIDRPPASRIIIEHMVDRACIGHCFSFGNYEPGSGQFRVRALPGNPYAMTPACVHIPADDEKGDLPRKLLPAHQVYQCAPGDLCLRPVTVAYTGEPVTPSAAR